MRVPVRIAVAIGALVAMFSMVLPTSASAASRPASVKTVVAEPGAKVGSIKVIWKASGKHTSKFALETALTPFDSSDDGRNAQTYLVKGSKRSYTLSATKVRAAGAAPETGNHLYIRVVGVTKSGSKKGKASPLVAAMPLAPVSPTVGVPLRIASYNIRSAKYDGDDKRKWAVRAPGVARDILAANPGIVAIQEASPGVYGGVRQTDSLQAALNAADPQGRYRITRTTTYSPPGAAHGSQAARILYDQTRYQLLTPCSDTTTVDGRSVAYSTSCSFELPIQPKDSIKWQRAAAYAEFVDLASGKPFLVVSAHLDYRHSSKKSLEAKYNALRGEQAATILEQVNVLRQAGEPVIVAGDFNASQTDSGGNAPHDFLVGQGFYDTAGAQQTYNLDLPTMNHFDTTLEPDPQGFARRIDEILVNGITSSRMFQVVSKEKDSERNSDHSMVVADVVLPPV